MVFIPKKNKLIAPVNEFSVRHARPLLAFELFWELRHEIKIISLHHWGLDWIHSKLEQYSSAAGAVGQRRGLRQASGTNFGSAAQMSMGVSSTTFSCHLVVHFHYFCRHGIHPSLFTRTRHLGKSSATFLILNLFVENGAFWYIINNCSS